METNPHPASRTALAALAPYGLLLLLGLVYYLPGFTSLPPTDRDESLFAQATRQMLETGDFVRIRFQERERNKKPVGIHWLQAAAVEAVGALGGPGRGAIWPYRLPSLTGALAAVLLTYAAGRPAFGRRAAFLGAALLAGSLLLVGEARVATTDAALLATVVMAQGALLSLYLRERRGERAPLATALLFWGAQGAAILLKGPIGPMVSGLTLIGLWGADRELRWARALRPALGLLLVAALVLPWGVAIWAATGGRFFRGALGGDLGTKLLAGQESHGAPPGSYLLLVALTFFPGSLLTAPALARAWRRRAQPAVRFCLAWLVPTWLLLELVPTKLPHYVLPLYPALALLAGALAADEKDLLQAGRGLLPWAAWWSLAALLLAAVPPTLTCWLHGRPGLTAPLATAALLLGTATALQALVRRRDALRAAVAALVGTALYLGLLLGGIVPHEEALWPAESAARAVARLESTGALDRGPVAATGYDEPSLVFLLGTDTRLLPPAAAADWLTDHPHRAALVADRVERRFLRELALRGTSARKLDAVHGFDTVKGRWLTLDLYTTTADRTAGERARSASNRARGSRGDGAAEGDGEDSFAVDLGLHRKLQETAESLDQRQAQAGVMTARTGRILAPETIEEEGEVGGREPVGGVGDREPQVDAPGPGAHPRRRALRAVGDRVGQQVHQDELELAGIGKQGEAAGEIALEVDAPRLRFRLEPPPDRFQEVTQDEAAGLHHVDAAVVPGQPQEVDHDALHLQADFVDVLEEAGRQLPIAGPAASHLGDRAQLGEGGAQLVGHVTRKAALAFEGGLEPLEQGVELIDHRRQLQGRGGELQAVRQAPLVERLDLPRDLLERPQAGAERPPDHHR